MGPLQGPVAFRRGLCSAQALEVVPTEADCLEILRGGFFFLEWRACDLFTCLSLNFLAQCSNMASDMEGSNDERMMNSGAGWVPGCSWPRVVPGLSDHGTNGSQGHFSHKPLFRSPRTCTGLLPWHLLEPYRTFRSGLSVISVQTFRPDPPCGSCFLRLSLPLPFPPRVSFWLPLFGIFLSSPQELVHSCSLLASRAFCMKSVPKPGQILPPAPLACQSLHQLVF